MKSHQPATKRLVALQLDQNLLAIIDTAAQRQFRSRSDYLRQAVLRQLELEGIVPLVAA